MSRLTGVLEIVITESNMAGAMFSVRSIDSVGRVQSGKYEFRRRREIRFTASFASTTKIYYL